MLGHEREERSKRNLRYRPSRVPIRLKSLPTCLAPFIGLVWPASSCACVCLPVPGRLRAIVFGELTPRSSLRLTLAAARVVAVVLCL
jgi:hypothetical protein